MNIQFIRERFKQYRQQISELNQAIEEVGFYHEESISRANRRADACRRECEERERQAESDRWYREDELRRATQDLERAQSYGDPYAVKRATDKIKSLNY